MAEEESPGVGTLNDLYSAAYEELRRLANSVKYSGPKATITPSTLVNEAWLRLAKSPNLSLSSELHFKHIAARAMRRILIEAARRRTASKRGGGAAIFVTFDDSVSELVSCDREMLSLNDALDELSRLNQRQAIMVECRFFGGLDVEEIAAVLDVSPSTVGNDWRAARAWLATQIRHGR